MIVNPQFFSYKIIIGSLIVVVAVLGVFSLNTYESNKAHQLFLEQEKKLVESELSQMILRYDEISLTSNVLSEQLTGAQLKARSALGKLRLLKGDVSVLSSFKSELSDIKSRNSSLFKAVDSINSLNERLEHDKLLAYNALGEQKRVNNSLIKANKSLNKTIEKAAFLTANSFEAKAYRSGTTTETSKAAQANRIDVCFTLAENVLTEKGMKDIYIQILNPLNNVIANKGVIEFGKSLLIYSDKQRINYDNKVLDICTSILADKSDKPFTKGTYYVSVFHKERKLGNTQIVLN